MSRHVGGSGGTGGSANSAEPRRVARKKGMLGGNLVSRRVPPWRRRCRHERAGARHDHSRRSPDAGAEGHGASSRRRSRRGSRSRSSATSRGSARRSAPAACASSRSRGCRSSRPPARSPRRTGWSSRPRAPRRRRPRGRTRRSSSSSSTTRSTAPVCDKGGECPLQDLTFRYGPGNTRMRLREAHLREADPDLADDRARPRALHPLLPLHALQRSVSEDGQLVAENRGAMSVITTFEDEPYRGAVHRQRHRALPGRRAASTQYRFEARPWEIQNVPTVCGLCPVGCNIDGSTCARAR